MGPVREPETDFRVSIHSFIHSFLRKSSAEALGNKGPEEIPLINGSSKDTSATSLSLPSPPLSFTYHHPPPPLASLLDTLLCLTYESRMFIHSLVVLERSGCERNNFFLKAQKWFPESEQGSDWYIRRKERGLCPLGKSHSAEV